MPVHKILVVDDSRTDLHAVVDMLRRQGFEVATADSGEQALVSLAESRPDLLLLDVVLPGKNGFQLTRTITRDPQYAGLPIILCSSKNQETDRLWGMRQGAKEYIVKPVKAEELLAKIRSID